MSNIYRHGDVDLLPVRSIPRGSKKIKGSTLAYGEVTGHHHTLYALDEDTKIQLSNFVQEQINKTYARITGGKALLKHQEHAPIVVEPGLYEIKIEEEADPFTQSIRKVMD